jgi:hypothetical protein
MTALVSFTSGYDGTNAFLTIAPLDAGLDQFCLVNTEEPS